VKTRVVNWWDSLSAAGRIHHHATALCVALFLFHYAWYSAWFVEDAAITFAYARNFALGDGFVTYVGGERVEGFSNPTWTLALAALRAVGIGPWVASKLLGALFGAATVVVGGQWGKRMLPLGRWSALVPLLLAMSPQHANWCASGLENAFFSFFLAAGCVSMLREVTEGGRPWSALWFAALAMTRPEAPMYVAVAGLTGWAFAFRMGFRRAMTWALSWGVVLLIPLLAWHGWRYAYFAWEFPNTYYAKLGEQERFQPMEWDKRGWDYLRGWFLGHGRGFVAPLFLLGVTGVRSWRGRIGLGIALVTVILIALGISWPSELMKALEWGGDDWGKRWDEPDLLVRGRVVWLAALVLLVPAVAMDRDKDAPRVLAWLMGCTVLFFALYSGGDWMRGWRWVSMAIVPISVVLASGIHAVVEAMDSPRARKWTTGLLLAILLIPDAIHAVMLVSMPVTTPYDVHRRVQYMQSVQDRMNIDNATIMDVDMGAHLWWFGPQIVDMAGLVDVPIGHNHYQLDFVDEYVYDTRNPTFAHVHASWASRTKLRHHDGWDNYVEVPAFPVSVFSVHEGNHVHRDHFVERADRSRSLVRFGSAVVLNRFNIPVKSVMPGGELFVELSWRRTTRSDGFRAFLFLANDDATHVVEVPPAYDYLPFRRWRKTEEIVGRHRIDIPMDLPEGRYDIGIYVFGEGEAAGVWPASSVGSTPVTRAPRVLEGEARWVRDITVTDEATLIAGYNGALIRVDELLTALRCEAAEMLWDDERRHLPNHHAYRQSEDERIRDGLASCYASQAETVDAEQAAPLLLNARMWSPRNRDLIRIGEALADVWATEASGLKEAGNQRAAVRSYERVLIADPSRSWDRRRLEELRAVYITELQAARDAEQARKEAERDAREAEREAREEARQQRTP
jgi:hypothetical protein